MFKQVLGMMPRKSAFNFAKRKKQLSIPQHSATFLLFLWVSLQAPQWPRALSEEPSAPQQSWTVHPKGYPLGKTMFFLRPHSIFSIKTAWGS